MSQDTAEAVGYGFPSTDCSLCERSLGTDDQQVCQWHSDETPTPLDRSALGICPGCRTEVAELVDTWTTVPVPPVDAGTLAAGYRQVAGDCSFCERSLDGDSVGMEYYRAGTDHDDGLADLSHYVLCPHCVSVFAEFLRGVASE